MKTSNESIDTAQHTPLVNLSPGELRQIRQIIWAKGTDEENRLERFLSMNTQLEDDAWWYAFRLAYEMSRVKKSAYKQLKEVVKGKNTVQAMMEKKEKEAFAALPDVLTLYKEMREEQWERGAFDLSWYLTEHRALNPPYHHQHEGKRKGYRLYTIKVHKTDVIALLNNRLQQEVLLNSKGADLKVLSQQIISVVT